MTSYVLLQGMLFDILRKIKEKDPALLKRLAERYCAGEKTYHGADLEDDMESVRLNAQSDWWPTFTSCLPDRSDGHDLFLELLRDLVDARNLEDIKVRNVRGKGLPLAEQRDYAAHVKEVGSGRNTLRNSYFAQPRVLREGDVLATGEKLLTDPREGGNGTVLLHLSGGELGTWIGVPSRIPIALYHESFSAPKELFEKHR